MKRVNDALMECMVTEFIPSRPELTRIFGYECSRFNLPGRPVTNIGRAIKMEMTWNT